MFLNFGGRKMKSNKTFRLQLLYSALLVTAAYVLLKNSAHPAKMDLIVEGGLFLFAGAIGFRGFLNRNKRKSKDFRRFELFYGLTYSVVTIACIMGLVFFLNHPAIRDIDMEVVQDSALLQGMSGVKSLSFVFMFLAWYYFYRNLKIQASNKKKLMAFLGGFAGYFGASLIILAFTGDQSIISLGIIVGAAIGLFAMIALHPATRYLSILFLAFSIVHLWEFYLMGMGKELVTGINNPVYWLIILLYAFEVNRWITSGQYKLAPQK